MTVYREPRARLIRSMSAIARQEASAPLELVVAACPDDAEVESALAYCDLPEVHLVENRSGRRSEGLNRAIAASSGSVVCRVDARSRISPRYVETCVRRLETDPRIGVVGGFQRPVAEGDGVVARGVARALRNPYVLGGAAYRRGGGGGPVDTVYLGSWRRADIEELGGFDERLDANEDFELCRRFAKAGRIVWLEDGLVVPYEARSRFADVLTQYHSFGRSKVRFWRTTGELPNGRQAVGLALGCCGVLAMPRIMAHPRRLVTAALIGGTAFFATDGATEPPNEDALIRAAAAVGSVCVVFGWTSGVVHEACLSLCQGAA